MFFMTLPKSMEIGDTVDGKINGEPKQITYRDAKTLVIEPGDARTILEKMDAGGGLQSFVCSDADGTSDFQIVTPDGRGGAAVMTTTDDITTHRHRKYWIAINGSSCAMSSVPMVMPTVLPKPQQLLGFPTLEEAKRAQHICLTAPMNEVRQFLQSLSPHVRCGRITVITFDDPDPPTAESTMWLDANPDKLKT
jgi:hypothetical protein